MPAIIKKYKYTFLTLLYFCIIVLYPINFQPRIVLLIGACSLFFVLNLLAKIKYNFIFVLLFACIIFFNAYASFIYSAYTDIGILGSTIETNLGEARGMMKDNVLAIFVIFCVTYILIYLSTKELKSLKLSIPKSLAIILIYLYTLSPLVYRRILITDLRDSYNNTPIYILHQAVNHYSPLFYGNLLTAFAYYHQIYTFKQYQKIEREMPKGITRDLNRQQVKKIYLVLGESSTRNHYSLYGYHIPTTPFLDSLNRADSINLKHYNAIASASYTRTAIPIMLSTSDVQNPFTFFKEKNLIDLAKMVGYHTSWVSNQARMDLLSVSANYIGSIAAGADASYFARSDDYYVKDMDLAPIIPEFKKDKDDLQLYIIHLIGSHQNYVDKYDEADAKAIKGEKNLTLDYDRSVHHTDRILREIYKLIEADDSSCLIYAPDHGEDVPIGHGLVPISKEQFEIPLITINNSEVDINTIVKKYIEPTSQTISNASIMYLVSELLGYHVSDSCISKSIEAGKYVMHGDQNLYQFEAIDK